MIKKERAIYITNKLEELYPETPIPLNHSNSYTLLVSVLLSAQCTDKKVNEVTPNLFKNRSTAKDIFLLGEKKIYLYIRSLGLAKTKARNILKMSQIIYKDFNNNVPCSFTELESLPGVGHKTASVVMSQAFGVPSFPVDTHIHRLAQRWGLTSGQNVIKTEYDLKKLFPRYKWNKLHLQIIFYGREHCTARGCDGTRCEICKTMYPNRKKAVICKKA